MQEHPNLLSQPVAIHWRMAHVDIEEISRIRGLEHRLKQVADLDRDLQVFGADVHKYESHPVPDADLERFEAGLGFHLPADYRLFLQLVGYGAGPYCGLLSPKQILENLRESSFERPDQLPAPGSPFPFSSDQAEECYQLGGDLSRGWLKERTWPVDGCIPICFEGGSFYTLIVTAGDLAGSLWTSHHETQSLGEDGQFYAYNLTPPPPGIIQPVHFDPAMSGDDLRKEYVKHVWKPAFSPAPTFLEWYSAWLDQCLADLEQRKDEPVNTPGGQAKGQDRGSRILWWFVIIAIITLLRELIK